MSDIVLLQSLIASSIAIAALSVGVARADDDFLKQAKEFTASATAPRGRGPVPPPVLRRRRANS